jgi:hypothetical protein
MVTIRGNQIVCNVNGTDVYTFTDSTLKSPATVGIVADAPQGATGVQVGFQNLRVTPGGGSSVGSGDLLVADFSQFPLEEQAGQYRTTFDKTAGEYHMALLTDNTDWTFYPPDRKMYGDIRVEMDGRRAAGPDDGGYGIAFRVQPKGANDKTSARYIFATYKDQFYVLLFNTDNTVKTIKDDTSSPAIKTGGGTNHLAVTIKGNQITCSINGTDVYTFTDTMFQQGSVGIYGEAPKGATGVELAYHDLRVSSP